MNAEESANQFINKETAFHLGDLITEKSHPLTRELSFISQRSISDGLNMLLKVDEDIIPVLRKVTGSSEFDTLVAGIVKTVNRRGRVIFSSCGASGRLAVILESIWREFWSGNSLEDQVMSIMTGGERALIRSVENFEDYQSFGRRQVKEAQLNENDLLIALTEGGEISSVIGTMKEALLMGSEVFMLFNNPRDLLIEKFQRSREVLTDPRILSIELTTGPMALSGSTRMQATTIGMLAIGIALEEAFRKIKGDSVKARSFYTDGFELTLAQLSSRKALQALSKLVDIEAGTYANKGFVTYLADQFLLDIFSDTTERTPTFMIPPFKSRNESDAPEPWTFARDPYRESNAAWKSMLKRSPRGLNWDSNDYREMQASESIIENPPRLSETNILDYDIGNTVNPSRSRPSDYYLYFELEGRQEATGSIDKRMLGEAQFTQVTIGNGAIQNQNSQVIYIPLNLRETGINLFEHVAIKLIFNTISTCTMARLGRIRGNWMVQVDATNKKLIDRATRIIQHFSGEDYATSCLELHKTMANPDIDRKIFNTSYVLQTLNRMGHKLL